MSADLYELLSNPNVAGIDLEFMSLEVCTGKDIVLKANGDPLIYRDNVFVLPVWDDLIVDHPLNLAKYVDRFYEHFEDAFDFLVFLPNVYLFEQFGKQGASPYFSMASNDVEGIRKPEDSQLEGGH